MTINLEAQGDAQDKPQKVCFVTIGATASFCGLLQAVLEWSFLEALYDAGYTKLCVQYGKADGKVIYDAFMAREYSRVQRDLDIEIRGFDFQTEGLNANMREAKVDQKTGRREGVVISHAGSGSILDALRVGVPLVVVPNRDLLDNHQVELAEELARQEYVVHGNLTHLSASLSEAEKLGQRNKQWPPPNSGEVADKRGLAGVIDDEMGWVD